jgi:hypothetical protein
VHKNGLMKMIQHFSLVSIKKSKFVCFSGSLKKFFLVGGLLAV